MNKDLILQEARKWLSLEQEGQNLAKNQNFLSWINVSVEHKKLFEEEKIFRESIQNLSAKYKSQKAQEVREEIQKENLQSKLRFLVPLAACFVFVVLAFMYNNEEELYYKQISSQNIVMKNIEMPDHSIISLDAKSNIQVTYTEKRREVILNQGKALFEVSSNKHVPFYVKSNQALIKVVGTKFEVVKEENKTYVSVLEGVVIVRHGYDEDTRILARLEKGDVFDISKSGKEKHFSRNMPNKIATWQNEKLIFEQTNLKDVIKQFSIYLDYQVKLDLVGNDKYPISGEFNVYEFDKFLDFLPLIYPIEIQRNNKNKIILKNN